MLPSKTNQQPHRKVKKHPKWQDGKREDFILNINESKISDLYIQLQQMQHNASLINKEHLNDICSSITEIFSESANKSFGNNSSPTQSKGNKSHKPWFGAQCQSARRKYHLARKINHLNPSPTNKLNLKNASLDYKCIMNFHLNQFNCTTQEKLRQVKSTSPKEFRKIINNLENSHQKRWQIPRPHRIWPSFFNPGHQRCNFIKEYTCLTLQWVITPQLWIRYRTLKPEVVETGFCVFQQRNWKKKWEK